MVIGFNKSYYSVEEYRNSLEVCIEVISGEVEGILPLEYATRSGSADGIL